MIAGEMGHYSVRPNYVNTEDLARLAEANYRELEGKIRPIFLNSPSFSEASQTII